MHACTRLSTSAAVAAILAILPPSPLHAEELKVAAYERCTFGRAAELRLPGPGDHVMALVENACTAHRSLGHTDLLDGGTAVHYVFRDYRGWEGPVQGYVAVVKGEDSFTIGWSGTTTAVPSRQGKLDIRFQGQWTFTRGTGRFADVKGGSGIWFGRVLSPTELESEMSGSLIR